MASTALADRAIGCGFLFAAASGTVAFILLQKPLLRRFDHLAVLAAAYGTASIIAAAVCAAWTLLFSPDGVAALALSANQTWALLYTVMLVGCAAYALFTLANARLPATVVTLYGILQPLLTSLLGSHRRTRAPASRARDCG